jgi:UDP-glucose 4-epimerase
VAASLRNQVTVKALVTGASGAIGPTLVDRLMKQGHAVRVLARRPPEPGLLPSGVETEVGDVADRAAVALAVKGIDVVFHLAALLHQGRPSPGLRAEYDRVNVLGTQLLTEASVAAGVRRLVYFSTICVYGPSNGSILDELSPLRPDTMYAETKARGEEIVLGARRKASAEPLATVLRLAAVYGRRIKGNYRRLADALASGWFVPIGNGENRRTLVHDRDVADAALTVANSPASAGGIYNVTDGRVHYFRDILGAMCAGLGQRAPRWRVPVGLPRAVAWGLDRLPALVGAPPRAGRLLDKYLEDVAVAGTRIEGELGFRPSVGLTEGWADALSGFRTAP